MAHSSENVHPLQINFRTIYDIRELEASARNTPDVLLIYLPSSQLGGYRSDLPSVLSEIVGTLSHNATFILIGEIGDLVHSHAAISEHARYQSWIAIKRNLPRAQDDNSALQHLHFGATIYTRYQSSLRHTKTRIAYSYCPACDKTTKDYGGKKHLYHEYGTLLSDVWRDIEVDLEGDVTLITQRFADLFGIEPYQELRVIDARSLETKNPHQLATNNSFSQNGNGTLRDLTSNIIINDDILRALGGIPDNSIDFIFADPPYNVKKNYTGYTDDLEIMEYFEWCDRWLGQLARKLKPGRTLALLNLPLWSIRHFLFLETVLQFQNWIVWDALSYPVRMIMPAQYTILCFTKGPARPLPGLTRSRGLTTSKSLQDAVLRPLAESFCLRASCVKNRNRNGKNDRGPLTDLWWDIHRLKHNTRRVDHPTQLPPQVMYRLISLFTEPGEMVLDPFNGSGTSTLCAHQLRRPFIGIEKESQYAQLARSRHSEIDEGIDPFRKEKRVLTAKNSPVPRLKEQKYTISKKTLQLEVKRIAKKLQRLPTREDVIAQGKYDIKYYEEYFVSWGEVCAAARTTGMKETRQSSLQLTLLEKKSKYRAKR